MTESASSIGGSIGLVVEQEAGGRAALRGVFSCTFLVWFCYGRCPNNAYVLKLPLEGPEWDHDCSPVSKKLWLYPVVLDLEDKVEAPRMLSRTESGRTCSVVVVRLCFFFFVVLVLFIRAFHSFVRDCCSRFQSAP